MSNKIDLGWCFCQECSVLWEYCKPMVEKAPEFGVKKIEISGITNIVAGTGNLDAFVHFKSHPVIRKTRDEKMISSNIMNVKITRGIILPIVHFFIVNISIITTRYRDDITWQPNDS